MAKVTITDRALVDDGKQMSDAEIGELSSAIGRLMEREFERALGFPPPQMPTTIELQPKRQCNCGPIFHRSNCPYACTA